MCTVYEKKAPNLIFIKGSLYILGLTIYNKCDHALSLPWINVWLKLMDKGGDRGVWLAPYNIDS